MTNDIKTVRLAGRDFPVPVLAIKQNQYVEPLAAPHIPFFIRAHLAHEKGEKISNAEISPQMTRDFVQIIYHALTRGTPTLTLDEFLEMPITMREIMGALPVCLDQSGLFQKENKAPEAQPQTGEATSPSTGTGL